MKKTLFIPRAHLLEGCQLAISSIQRQLTDISDKQMVKRLLQAIQVYHELTNSDNELFKISLEAEEVGK